VALEVFDMAVVSGAEAARRALQVALRLPETDLPATEFLLEIRQADPVRLRARFLIARLADIAGRLSGP
jgi:lysozyme family protein